MVPGGMIPEVPALLRERGTSPWGDLYVNTVNLTDDFAVQKFSLKHVSGRLVFLFLDGCNVTTLLAGCTGNKWGNLPSWLFFFLLNGEF